MCSSPKKQTADLACGVYVDMGTTNTRVWFMRDAEILARAQAGVGVRDTARDGSPTRIRSGLRDLIQEVRQEVRKRGIPSEPTSVLAAGMITSPLGLAEVPHILAPAGVNELAGALRRFDFPDITDLPILLVPGVRSGPLQSELASIGEADVMRGEETLCLGLAASGLVHPPAALLNLGSHWKAIRLDAQGRIQSSATTLSGELVHAAQTQTILASAVPKERPAVLDSAWCEAGMKEQRSAGLARTLFCVRLLELQRTGSPEQRLSYLIGAFVASDFDAYLRQGVLASGTDVVLAGSGVIANAWQIALEKASIRAVALREAEIEAGLFAGLRTIASRCGLLSPWP